MKTNPFPSFWESSVSTFSQTRYIADVEATLDRVEDDWKTVGDDLRRAMQGF